MTAQTPSFNLNDWSPEVRSMLNEQILKEWMGLKSNGEELPHIKTGFQPNNRINWYEPSIWISSDKFPIIPGKIFLSYMKDLMRLVLRKSYF